MIASLFFVTDFSITGRVNQNVFFNMSHAMC
nr:MAG TPA: hypothetical protein [Caudoviricetes sp.]